MKKAISVLLTLCFLCTIIILPVSASDNTDLKIAVASDLHYEKPLATLTDDIDDSIYFYANRRAAMENESGFIIDSFLSQVAESDCRYVLICGDMCNSGRTDTEAHGTVAEKLRAFEDSTGKDVFVINGNHDFGRDSDTDMTKYKEIYAGFGYDKALVTDENTCSYTADLGKNYRLIALDSCDDTVSTEDGMDARRLLWVLEQAKKAKEDGRYPILMMHHNLLDHLPVQRIVSRNFIVKFHFTTADLFADAGIRVALTGHEHCSDVAVHTSNLGNTVVDFATTSLTMYPLQYREMTFSDDSIVYEAKTVEHIDTDALTAAVNGYTERQIALMNEDFTAYAKGFMQAGIRYRLALGLTMEKIGISEGEFGYTLVNTAVSGLTNLLEMPLYGENSAESLAASYGLTLPETQYKTGWELVTSLAGAHYEGEENYIPTESAEVTLLLRLVSLLLRDDLSAVADTVFLRTANEILDRTETDGIAEALAKETADIFGCVTPGQYFLAAVLSPLLYEFAVDGDGIPDNNGRIDGYALKNNTENLFAKVETVFRKIALYFSLFFTMLMK